LRILDSFNNNARSSRGGIIVGGGSVALEKEGLENFSCCKFFRDEDWPLLNKSWLVPSLSESEFTEFENLQN
jgi:hypothetical protein